MTVEDNFISDTIWAIKSVRKAIFKIEMKQEDYRRWLRHEKSLDLVRRLKRCRS